MAGPENRFERARLLSAAFDPIIDICLRLGVNVREIESLVRVQFVKRLGEVLPPSARSGKEASHDAVALAAGLTRQEVQRIRSQGSKKSAQQRMRKKSEQGASSQRVTDRWRTDPKFMNNSGGTLALPVSGAYSGGPSFEDLVRKALPHRRLKSVLDDMTRRGMIQVSDGIVRLRRTARPLPTELNAQALDHLAGEMRRLGETLLKSIENPQGDDRSLALFVQSEPFKVPADQLAATRAAMQERIASFLQEFARDHGRKSKSKKRKGEGVTIAASVYTAPER